MNRMGAGLIGSVGLVRRAVDTVPLRAIGCVQSHVVLGGMQNSIVSHIVRRGPSPVPPGSVGGQLGYLSLVRVTQQSKLLAMIAEESECVVQQTTLRYQWAVQR
mmetsp:Transcript_76102/g.199609  ORF Transcript_76102/g.199609 Transcript_76102/m.199609 type:complete len:104 (+) Transcript_76102:294-605(+)